MAGDLVFAYGAGFGERQIQAELLAYEKFKALAADGETAFRALGFSGHTSRVAVEGPERTLDGCSQDRRLARGGRELFFDALEKLDCTRAGLDCK